MKFFDFDIEVAILYAASMLSGSISLDVYRGERATAESRINDVLS